MANLKHVGRYVPTGRKCVVAYRTIPGDAYNCLIVTTENLEESYHDALIRVVESSAAQEAYELAEALTRSQFPDGSTMLARLHASGRLIKVPTDSVEMTPSIGVTINLAELNQIIAEQRGVAVGDLSIKPEVAETKKPEAEVADIVQVKDLSVPLKETPESKTQLEAQIASLAEQVAALTNLVNSQLTSTTVQHTTTQQAINAESAISSDSVVEQPAATKTTRKVAK